MARGGSCSLNNRRSMVHLIRWVFSLSRAKNMHLEVDDATGNVKSNTILAVWGPLLVAFGDRSFIESFANGSTCICNSMYFGHNTQWNILSIESNFMMPKRYIQHKNSQMLVGGCYRPPGSPTLLPMVSKICCEELSMGTKQSTGL